MHVTARLAAIAMFALTTGLLQASVALACIKYNRPAEVAMLDKAIASSDTSKDRRTALKSARAKLKQLGRKTDSASISEYSTVVRQALELIGGKRIVWHAPEADANKTRSLPPLPQTANSPVAMPACG